MHIAHTPYMQKWTLFFLQAFTYISADEAHEHTLGFGGGLTNPCAPSPNVYVPINGFYIWDCLHAMM